MSEVKECSNENQFTVGMCASVAGDPASVERPYRRAYPARRGHEDRHLDGLRRVHDRDVAGVPVLADELLVDELDDDGRRGAALEHLTMVLSLYDHSVVTLTCA